MTTFNLIAFDADDTLWHNERLFSYAHDRFAALLSRYHNPEWIHDRLYQTEVRNIQHYGYGIKAFALSMIETAVELTEGRVTGADIQSLIDLAREMLTAEVELLPHVAETIPQLAAAYPLMLITKGDLLDQETKLNRSGLSGYFRHVEVVSQKTPETYTRLLNKYSLDAARFLMIGNSLKSDILPILAVGGHAVHIPYEITWLHESAEPPPAGTPGFHALEHMGQLPALLEKIDQR